LGGVEAEGETFFPTAREASEETFASAADRVFIEHAELFRRLAQ
jgi:hypothetical protein